MIRPAGMNNDVTGSCASASTRLPAASARISWKSRSSLTKASTSAGRRFRWRRPPWRPSRRYSRRLRPACPARCPALPSRRSRARRSSRRPTIRETSPSAGSSARLAEEARSRKCGEEMRGRLPPSRSTRPLCSSSLMPSRTVERFTPNCPASCDLGRQRIADAQPAGQDLPLDRVIDEPIGRQPFEFAEFSVLHPDQSLPVRPTQS